jgi:hypothetical protein
MRGLWRDIGEGFDVDEFLGIENRVVLSGAGIVLSALASALIVDGIHRRVVEFFDFLGMMIVLLELDSPRLVGVVGGALHRREGT